MGNIMREIRITSTDSRNCRNENTKIKSSSLIISQNIYTSIYLLY